LCGEGQALEERIHCLYALPPRPRPWCITCRQMSKRHLTAASSRSRAPRAFLSPSHLAQHSYPQTSPCPWSCLAALVSRPSVSRRFHTKTKTNTKPNGTVRDNTNLHLTLQKRKEERHSSPLPTPSLSPLHALSPSAFKGAGLGTAVNPVHFQIQVLTQHLTLSYAS
jgi:hypothetical protein